MGSTPLTAPLWWQVRRTRAHFERGARDVAPWLLGRPTSDGFGYLLFLPVEDLGSPQITIKFPTTDPTTPMVYSPTTLGASPHRYPDHRMCLWYPWHPREQRWEFDDGLRELLIMAGAHLIREDLYRRFGTWPGPEMPHGHPGDDQWMNPT
jgi:hypothetical protein